MPLAPTDSVRLNLIASSLQSAAAIARPAHCGMRISLLGTLSHAARSLRDLAVAPEFAGVSSQALQEHEHRCESAQPELRAYGLEQLGRHLELLKVAVETNDSMTIRQFFELYAFQ